MAQRTRGGAGRQPELIARSMATTIQVQDDHDLVVLTKQLDWAAMGERAEQIRHRKLKSAAGRPPHLRQMLGVLVLMAVRKVPYRVAEDLVRYYAPARYLCGLTETDWTPDFRTMNDFTQLMGEDGIKELNQDVVKVAVDLKLADPKVVAADTTAQEAAIPYPNEMGLMATFFTAVACAGKKAGSVMKALAKNAAAVFHRAHAKLREYRFFAKTKEHRATLLRSMASMTEKLQRQLGAGLRVAHQTAARMSGNTRRALNKVDQLHQTMNTLLPQIRYWLKTGFVATGKIINLHIPKLYSIVRGKVGKKVEFGLNWGITRLRGGFVLATLAKNNKDLVDARFAVRAVEHVIGLFGKAPRSYAYDRGAYSKSNISKLKKLGVKNVGLAPRGKAEWQVGERLKKQLTSERVQVEGCIGAMKGAKYGFNKPAARSVDMMGACGQRAAFGFNLTKLVRGLAELKKQAAPATT
jgi:hypothetical protein